MADHTIKVKRASKIASIGKYPGTWNALLAHVPHELVQTLTVRQLAQTVDVLWACAQASKAIATREAISEGGVWDSRQRAFAPFMPPVLKRNQP